jgi:exopolysaccharide biosynthesis polyprenyl glycosylphosphotransferase
VIRNFSLSFTALLIVLDVAAIVTAIVVAETLRIELPFGAEGPDEQFETPHIIFLILPLAWLYILNTIGAYSPRQTHRAVLEVLNQVRAVAIALLVFAGIFFIGYREFSRLQLVYIVSFLGLFNISLRGLVRLYFRLTGGRKYDARRVLIVGTGNLARAVGRQVRSYAWTGLYLVGYVAIDDNTLMQLQNNVEDHDDKPTIGTANQLKSIIDEHDIDETIFAIQRPTYDALSDLIAELYRDERVRVRMAPDFQDLAYLSLTVEDLEGLPLIGLRDNVLSLPQRVIKRLIDIVVSSILLIFAIPMMIVIVIVIMIDSRGAPFFIQDRIAQGMRPFKMIKFRTMVRDAEMLQENVNHYDDEGNLIHKFPDDDRITRVGRFLRRTSLDELPQFFNVLMGHMSLVGPRPELPWMVDRYKDWQMKRFEVPQGLTGWWQINGRAETPMHLATEDDLFYILNYSLMLDLIILLRTPFVVFGGRGAF